MGPLFSRFAAAAKSSLQWQLLVALAPGKYLRNNDHHYFDPLAQFKTLSIVIITNLCLAFESAMRYIQKLELHNVWVLRDWTQ